MTSPDLFQYLRSRACSRQWSGFVHAMAEEFASELPDHELSTLMARIGLRFAREHELSDCAALHEVEVAANQVWEGSEWGFCRMVEHENYVDIQHMGAPMAVVLEAAPWSDGFLEGVYQGWFQQMGMLAGLRVRTLRSDDVDVRRFALSRAL